MSYPSGSVAVSASAGAILSCKTVWHLHPWTPCRSLTVCQILSLVMALQMHRLLVSRLDCKDEPALKRLHGCAARQQGQSEDGPQPLPQPNSNGPQGQPPTRRPPASSQAPADQPNSSQVLSPLCRLSPSAWPHVYPRQALQTHVLVPAGRRTSFMLQVTCFQG